MSSGGSPSLEASAPRSLPGPPGLVEEARLPVHTGSRGAPDSKPQGVGHVSLSLGDALGKRSQPPSWCFDMSDKR